MALKFFPLLSYSESVPKGSPSPHTNLQRFFAALLTVQYGPQEFGLLEQSMSWKQHVTLGYVEISL